MPQIYTLLNFLHSDEIQKNEGKDNFLCETIKNYHRKGTNINHVVLFYSNGDEKIEGKNKGLIDSNFINRIKKEFDQCKVSIELINQGVFEKEGSVRTALNLKKKISTMLDSGIFNQKIKVLITKTKNKQDIVNCWERVVQTGVIEKDNIEFIHPDLSPIETSLAELDDIIAKYAHASSAINDLLQRLKGYAQQDNPRSILFTGNPGVGKTRIAEIYGMMVKKLHNHDDAPSITFDCGQFYNKNGPYQLFGDPNGVFEGGVKTEGIVFSAGRGVLILDEFGEIRESEEGSFSNLLNPSTRTYQRAGEDKPRKVKGHIVATMNENVYKALKIKYQSRFQIEHIDDINNRPEDKWPLFQIFNEQKYKLVDGLTKSLTFSGAVKTYVEQSSFPFSARDLEKFVESIYNRYMDLESHPDNVEMEPLISECYEYALNVNRGENTIKAQFAIPSLEDKWIIDELDINNKNGLFFPMEKAVLSHHVEKIRKKLKSEGERETLPKLARRLNVENNHKQNTLETEKDKLENMLIKHKIPFGPVKF